MTDLGGGGAQERAQSNAADDPGAAAREGAGVGLEARDPEPAGSSAAAEQAFGQAANFRPLIVAHAAPILALDVATSMGWALRTAAGVTSGRANWAERRGETRGDRLYRFHRWLNAMNACGLALVVYELVQGPGKGAAQHVYSQFEGILLAWAARYRIPVRSVPSMTLKKAIAGTGRADKPAMLAAVRSRGYAPDSHDEADAIAVLLWAMGVRA